MISTEERLKIFQDENNIYTKGPLSLVVQFTRLVQDKKFQTIFKQVAKGRSLGLAAEISKRF